MAKKKKNKEKRSAEMSASMSSWLCSSDAFETLCTQGYTRLSQNPEVMSAVTKIADLVSSMTIYLMRNGESGDIRVVNELSKKIDIAPNDYMTRKTFIAAVVRDLLLEGNGNAIVIPKTSGGYLDSLDPIAPEKIRFEELAEGYRVHVNGRPYGSSDVLHFLINPDPSHPWKGTGYKTLLKDVANNLKQAGETKKGFMESKWKPSVIVKVDAMAEELASKEGRKQILQDYVENSEAGEPWIVPAETFEIEQIKPLSLTDLALSDSVTLDKRTVASILDVPAFVLGVGDFNAAAWNNFINTRIGHISQILAQELTKKILISPEMYFLFNMRSLYSYDINVLSSVGVAMRAAGMMTGNEVRGWLNLSPLEGLDELTILENYIPAGMVGNQKKLKGEEE